jgi:hypothetical protein
VKVEERRLPVLSLFFVLLASDAENIAPAISAPVDFNPFAHEVLLRLLCANCNAQKESPTLAGQFGCGWITDSSGLMI